MEKVSLFTSNELLQLLQVPRHNKCRSSTNNKNSRPLFEQISIDFMHKKNN